MEKKGIKVEKLTHIFAEVFEKNSKALKDISIDFDSKEITAIIGPSASGKTVLLKHLNGLLIPTLGRVIIDDYIIKSKQKKNPQINKVRKKIGFVFQFVERQLFEETVEKDIIFGPLNFGFSKLEAKKNAKKYLKLFGLSETYLQRSPFELSGGQKRRVAIAGILAYEPDFIIFDQLANGFDLTIKNEFFNLLLDLKTKMNKTIIFASNNSDDVLRLADRVVVLYKGQVVADTKPEKLFNDVNFCEKIGIQVPKTIYFLNLWKKYGFLSEEFNFKSENELIKSIVIYFKEQRELIK